MDPLKMKLFGALVGLARASEEKELIESSADAMIQGLIMACGRDGTGGDGTGEPEAAEHALTQEQADAMVTRLHEEKYRMSPDCAACQCPCGRTDDYDMNEVLFASEKLRDAKLTLFGLIGKLAEKLAAGMSEETAAEALTAMNQSLFLISCTFEAGQLADVTERVRKFLK